MHMRYQEGQAICKKFLVMLAAISHTLLRNQSGAAADQTPSQTAQRYASENYFALDKEVR